MIKQRIINFTDLEAWKKGHKLVLFVYRLTAKFPQKELFVLVSQIRRGVISITSNIAEGFTRKSYKEKIQFYYMALGSLAEIQNQMIIAKDINYISEEEYKEFLLLSTEVHKIINGLIRGGKVFLNSKF